MADENDISRLLHSWNIGDPEARDELIPMVFEELRCIARQQMASESTGHTLQPTALVHELYLKLVEQKRVQWKDRREFFGVAARLSRRILVDHARRRRALKRGAEVEKSSLEEAIGLGTGKLPDLIALDDALHDLAKVNPRGKNVVELYFFAGLDFGEISEVLEISRSTTMRAWSHARLWLCRELADA